MNTQNKLNHLAPVADEMLAGLQADEAMRLRIVRAARAQKQPGKKNMKRFAPAAAFPAVMLPEVRAVLAEKCSKGFRAQVKALIDSFGASALRDVAPEHYGELLGMARQLSEAPATASGGNPERGEVAGPEGEQDAG